MSRLIRSATGQRLRRIVTALTRSRPSPHVELHFHDPWQLLVATILSAQCTDQRVNQVTPALFRRYVTPADLAKAAPAELEALIKPTGFYKNKAKHLIACAKILTEEFAQTVPRTMEKLTTLPGVGRKTRECHPGECLRQACDHRRYACQTGVGATRIDSCNRPGQN